MSPQIFVVTGAARGIGYALVQALAERPDTVVYAGVRSFPVDTNSELGQLAAKYPDAVIPIKITSADEADNQAAAALIKERYSQVDCVIACAGVASALEGQTVRRVTPADILDDVKINSTGPVTIFQALAELLLASHAAGGQPKFVAVSSLAARIVDPVPIEATAYGASKAALNYIMAKMNLEMAEIVAFPIHPGFVLSDMSKQAQNIPLDGAISPKESATGMLNVIEKATKESHGGKFWDYAGTQLQY